MNRILVFFLGIITGVGLIIFTILIVNLSNTETQNEQDNNLNDPNINLSETPIEFTEATEFEIFQVWEKGALAKCREKTLNNYSRFGFHGPVVYLPAEGENMYFDDQIIVAPAGKKVMQIGTFRYETALTEKVVPIIEFI